MTLTRRTPFTLLVALLVTAGLLSTAAPAPAAPKAATDFEGGSPALLAALEAASRGYSEAKATLEASRKRQVELQSRQRAMEVEVAGLSAQVDEVAAETYRGGNPDLYMASLDTASIDLFLDRSELLGHLSTRNAEKIRALASARDELAEQRKKIDAELRTQQRQERAMAKRKADAERALRVSVDGSGGASARAGRSAPRRSDGSFAPQSCSQDDPTTSGCLTARTVNALAQAKAAGFTRFVACFRQASFGEHPKGRACDFSSASGGFAGVASGGDRSYGDNLAQYFINNADRLGVLYVIWFRRIWLPGVGWRAYTRGNGDPSSDHTNHVHLSVR